MLPSASCMMAPLHSTHRYQCVCLEAENFIHANYQLMEDSNGGIIECVTWNPLTIWDGQYIYIYITHQHTQPIRPIFPYPTIHLHIFEYANINLMS